MLILPPGKKLKKLVNRHVKKKTKDIGGAWKGPLILFGVSFVAVILFFLWKWRQWEKKFHYL